MPLRLHPVNPAEAVIAPFFDRALSPEDEWRLEAAPGTVGLRKGRGYTTMLFWDAAIPGQTAFTWSWCGQLDVSDYDGLFIQAAFPATVQMTFSALVDGRWQVIAQARGCDTHDDYQGPFQGKTLQGLRLEFVPETATAGAFGTYYIGVYNQRRLEDWLVYENPTVYPSDWPEYIKPEAAWGPLCPELGLYFDAAEVDALRSKIARPPYKALADLLRQDAHAALQRQPERWIRRYTPCGPQPYAYSARARDRGLPLWGDMELCAFFGLVDRDPQLLRMAARFALSLAHCQKWSEGFVEHDFPGSAVNWRSFYQNLACIALANTLDWIGPILTDHAKEVLCHSLYFKGLVPILYDFARYEYIYHMNQAVVFSPGRIGALLAWDHYWPRVAPLLEQARHDLDETCQRILYDDGGYGEGPAYYSGVMQYMLAAYLLLARREGTDPMLLLPAGAVKGADYFGTFVSTVKAAHLPIADGGTGGLSSDWLAMFARVTGDPRWNKLLADWLAGDLEQAVHTIPNLVWCESGVRTLVYGPADLSRQEEIVPVFRIHHGTGHATSRRATPWGLVRVHLCGSSPTEGHSHEDKGALLLEAFGEVLLLDRGTPIYSDPLTGIIKDARLHNVLTLQTPDGRDLEQLNPCPAAICPSGEGDERRLHLVMDVTAAWGQARAPAGPQVDTSNVATSGAVAGGGALVQRMVRRLDSDDPLHLTLTDEVVLTEARPVAFHLHSYAPVHIEGHTAVFSAAKSRLVVRWEWPAQVYWADVDLSDGDHRPVYHLALRAPAAREHRLVTQLEVQPSYPAPASKPAAQSG